MKQWWVVPGDEGAVIELREVERPLPGLGQVVVRTAGAGVNREELLAGAALRADNPKTAAQPSGIELAGRIEPVGEGVAGWAVGDRVMARGTACHAEAAVIDAAALSPARPGSPTSRRRASPTCSSPPTMPSSPRRGSRPMTRR